MRTNDENFIKPAMDIIKRTDIETYNKMTADDWQVAVIDEDNVADMLYMYVVPEIGMQNAVVLMNELDTSLGITVNNDPVIPPALRRSTWLNRNAITGAARYDVDTPVPVAELTAQTLVHEYAHAIGAREGAAYNAGTRFALKLGEPSLARYSQRVGEQQQFANPDRW